MPITQDRVLAVITAAEAFAGAHTQAQNDAQALLHAHALRGNPVEEAPALVEALVQALATRVETRHYVVLATERTHFKHTFHRNQRAAKRSYQKRRDEGKPTRESETLKKQALAASNMFSEARQSAGRSALQAQPWQPTKAIYDSEIIIEKNGLSPEDFLGDFMGEESATKATAFGPAPFMQLEEPSESQKKELMELLEQQLAEEEGNARGNARGNAP